MYKRIEDNFYNISFYDYDLNYYSLDGYMNSGEGADIFLNRIIGEAVRWLKIIWSTIGVNEWDFLFAI